MKKYINIILASAIGALTVLSCAQKETPYEPGAADPSDCYGVFFPSQDAMGSHTYDPTMEKAVSITVTRTNTSGAITVPFTTTVSDEGIFNFGTIAFADGQSETELEVTFPNAPEGKDLSFSVQLTDDNAYISKYNTGAIALDFSVLCVEMKDFMTEDGSKKAMLTFSDDVFWGEVHDDVYLQYYEVDGIRYCTTTGGKLVGPADGSDGVGPWGTDVQLSFKWYLNQKMTVGEGSYDFIEVTPQYHGWYNSTRSSEVWFADYYNYYQNNASSPYNGDIIKFYTNNGASYPPCYYDGHGGFVFNLAYYMPTSGGYWYGFNQNSPVAIAEGYLRVDYSLKLETDYSSDGVTPVYIEAGADVASVKYAVYPGELNSAQTSSRFEAMLSGEDPTETYDSFEFDEETAKNYGAFGIEPETSGIYTVLAIACSKDGKAQTQSGVVVNHVAAGDVEENEVNVSVFTEDTPERYKQLYPYDSFAYGISGTGLTEVHVGIIAASAIKDVNTTLNAVKSNASLAVTEDVLAEINADGGYYTVATGLNAKTQYYVIVWATNGNMDNFAVASYTTSNLPYKWKNLGKGEYTDDVACGLYGIDPITVSCNVYEEETTPGLYAIDGFQLPLVATIFEVTEEEMAAYEDGNWRNSFIIIDATNPASVTIALQDYGVCLNSSEGFIDGVTSLYKGEPFSVGTLENGVITFPTVKGLLCTLNGEGYYYANQHGAFKLVLPEAVSGAPAIKTGASTKPQRVLREFAGLRPVIERDAQPVKVSVEIPVARKEKERSRAKMVEKIQSAPVLR